MLLLLLLHEHLLLLQLLAVLATSASTTSSSTTTTITTTAQKAITAADDAAAARHGTSEARGRHGHGGGSLLCVRVAQPVRRRLDRVTVVVVRLLRNGAAVAAGPLVHGAVPGVVAWCVKSSASEARSWGEVCFRLGEKFVLFEPQTRS